MASKYDWETAQRLFVEGIANPENEALPTYPNLREVGEQMGIPYQQVRERSARERWKELKAKAMVEAAAKRRRVRVEKLSGEAIKFDDQSLTVAKMGMALVQMRLGEIGEHVRAKRDSRQRALERMANGDVVDWLETASAINYKEIQGLAIAASAFNELGQKALGTDAINVNVNGQLGFEVDGEVHVSVREEMLRPDPDRIASILSILERVNIKPELVLGIMDDNGVIEGEADEAPDGLNEMPEGIEA